MNANRADGAFPWHDNLAVSRRKAGFGPCSPPIEGDKSRRVKSRPALLSWEIGQRAKYGFFNEHSLGTSMACILLKRTASSVLLLHKRRVPCPALPFMEVFGPQDVEDESLFESFLTQGVIPS